MVHALTPLRYTVAESAELLRMGRTSLRELMKAGEFTVVTSDYRRGRGVKQWIPADEVEAFAVGGLEALREFRAKKKRK